MKTVKQWIKLLEQQDPDKKILGAWFSYQDFPLTTDDEWDELRDYIQTWTRCQSVKNGIIKD